MDRLADSGGAQISNQNLPNSGQHSPEKKLIAD